jgi:hypothetical protein
MWLKAILFLVIAVVAGALVWLESPTLRTAALLVLALWAACRAYYFAFYVIGHYVDSSYKFSGLGSFVKWWWTRKS